MPGSRAYTLITALFAAVLIISNVASAKIATFGGLTLDGGTLLFPLSYIFGDVLTEVYGYAGSRPVIWIGFGCTALASVVFAAVGALPPAPDWHGQAAFTATLGLTPRIVAASLLAFLVGEFANSFVMAKMKIATRGRWLWTRTLGSTLVGQAVDTGLFVTVAFTGVLPWSLILPLILSNYVFKVGVEALLTPVTYRVVAWLKRHDGCDVYDHDTDFNPFRA